jgi:hypothetical protein
MAVSVNATGTGQTGAASTTGFTEGASHITIAAGSNIVLALMLQLSAKPASVTANWDSAGTNQLMTQVGSTQAESDNLAFCYIFGLIAPTTGGKLLKVTWATTSATFSYCLIAFNGADQGSVAGTFKNFQSGNPAASTSVAGYPTGGVNVNSPTGDWAILAVASNNRAFQAVGQGLVGTNIYVQNTNVSGGGVQTTGAGASTNLECGCQTQVTADPACWAACDIAAVGTVGGVPDGLNEFFSGQTHPRQRIVVRGAPPFVEYPGAFTTVTTRPANYPFDQFDTVRLLKTRGFDELPGAFTTVTTRPANYPFDQFDTTKKLQPRGFDELHTGIKTVTEQPANYPFDQFEGIKLPKYRGFDELHTGLATIITQPQNYPFNNFEKPKLFAFAERFTELSVAARVIIPPLAPFDPARPLPKLQGFGDTSIPTVVVAPNIGPFTNFDPAKPLAKPLGFLEFPGAFTTSIATPTAANYIYDFFEGIKLPRYPGFLEYPGTFTTVTTIPLPFELFAPAKRLLVAAGFTELPRSFAQAIAGPFPQFDPARTLSRPQGFAELSGTFKVALLGPFAPFDQFGPLLGRVLRIQGFVDLPAFRVAVAVPSFGPFDTSYAQPRPSPPSKFFFEFPGAFTTQIVAVTEIHYRQIISQMGLMGGFIHGGGAGGGGGPVTPGNAYVAEDGTTFYVAEDGTTFYVQET